MANEKESNFQQITITVDKDNLLIIDKAADKMRQSRSGYMEIAALQRAKKDLNNELEL